MDIVSTKKPQLVFLMEVKIGRQQVERVKNKLKFEGCFIVDSVKGDGGLTLLWKEKNWVRLISFSRNYIDVSIHIPDMPTWRLTGYYGFPKRTRRKDSWEMLKNLSDSTTLPWCCIGDYNDFLAQAKKRRKLNYPNSLIQGFREVVDYCGLKDVV